MNCVLTRPLPPTLSTSAKPAYGSIREVVPLRKNDSSLHRVLQPDHAPVGPRVAQHLVAPGGGEVLALVDHHRVEGPAGLDRHLRGLVLEALEAVWARQVDRQPVPVSCRSMVLRQATRWLAVISPRYSTWR